MTIHQKNSMKLCPNRKALQAISASILALSLASANSYAQDAASQNSQTKNTQVQTAETVVVRGFRSSLRSAIAAKRMETDIVDAIRAEDIGKFPDLNLAESLQRISGVAIDRDGGEGRSITVRGLGPDFTRVRLNGLETIATTGGKDASGGTNRGRGFDFNIFASDLFNGLTVRKSLSAEIEEGSLGATVDLRTARPMDYPGFTMAASTQAGWNDLTEKANGRGTFMVSNKFLDGKFGALFSIAYGERLVWDEGPNTTRWDNGRNSFESPAGATSSGRFESFSTNGGTSFTTIPICTTTVNCVALAAGSEAANVVNALHPRIPRYSRYATDQKRLGMTTSLQWRPNDDALITLDGLYAKYNADREQTELEAISFSRTGAGTPRTDVYNYTIDSSGVMVKGTFNDVDLRTEHRFDKVETTFNQINLTYDQKITEKFKGTLLIGASNSLLDIAEQTTFTLDSYDVDGYSYDYTNMRNPQFNYGTSPTGCTLSQACFWTYVGNGTGTSANASNGLGDASLIRLRPQSVENSFKTGSIAFQYDWSDNIKIKFGGSTKLFTMDSVEFGRVTGDPLTTTTRNENGQGAIVAAIAGNIGQYGKTYQLNGQTFWIADLDKIRSQFGYDCRCVNQYGDFRVNTINGSSRGNNFGAQEDDFAYYLQADFKGELFSMPVRGNIGVRKVTTSQTVDGLIARATVDQIRIKRSYEDTLPAFNITFEPLDNLLVRLATSKTMSRPTLQSLSPGGSISTTAQTMSIGNPFLDPIRANTYDASVEWYPNRDTVLSVGFFKKDYRSYIQNLSRQIPFSETGYDISLLSGTNLTASSPFVVTQFVNTPGGSLQGYELNINQPFKFLPGFLSRTGGIVSFTKVESQIDYIVNPTSGATVRANLLNLSPQSWSATAYYEGEHLSARVSVSDRAEYISQFPAASGANYLIKDGTRNIDTQISYRFNDHLTIVFEGINLTDEFDYRGINYSTAYGNNAEILHDTTHSGRQFYLGARYKF